MHSVQRRGRAGSGPLGDNYSIDTECADLAAVRAATGARYVFGHSYGGLVALDAARHDPGITKLALYEPGVSVQGLFPTDWIPQYRRFLAQGRPFDALAIFAIATGPAAARRSPRWLTAAILRLAFRRERRAKVHGLLEANLHEHQEVGRLDDSYPQPLRDDPVFRRSVGHFLGRDGCRVPMPWSGTTEPYGWHRPWLPPPDNWTDLTVAAQQADPTSTLWLYRDALRIRRAHDALGAGELRWHDAPPGGLVFEREPGFVCAINFGPGSMPLPGSGKVLLASSPLDDAALPPDTAVWLQAD